MFSRNSIVYFLKDKQLGTNIINKHEFFSWLLSQFQQAIHVYASVGFMKRLQMTGRWPLWVAVLNSRD